MSILQNAVDSIALGIEDYNSPDPRRLVSCTRNIFAGILLLFKHKLWQLSAAGSDEALLKQRVLPVLTPSGEVQWHGKGKKTVDVQEIRERFENLDIDVDWRRINNINKHRNEVEHYFSSLSQSAVQALIADCFIIIRDFIRSHLGQDPRSLLGQGTWSVLTGVTEVYETEKKECTEHIEAIDWGYKTLEDALLHYRCPKCGSGLIDVAATEGDRSSATFTCRSCGHEWPFEEFAALAITDYFAVDNYVSIKDGGERATTLCPICGEETYLLEDDICPVCEESIERECQRCGCEIPPEELDGEGYCSYCAHMMSKDD